jgi:hypothetical protein
MGIHKISLGKELSIVKLYKNCITLGLGFFDASEVSKSLLLIIALEMDLIAIAVLTPRNPVHLLFVV